jgi:hypothetical protein
MSAFRAATSLRLNGRYGKAIALIITEDFKRGSSRAGFIGGAAADASRVFSETDQAIRDQAHPRSGDDVGQKLVLDLGDLILEGKLSLFQPADRELIRSSADLECQDLVIEQAVLRAKLNQLLPKVPIVLPVHVVARSNSSLQS